MRRTTVERIERAPMRKIGGGTFAMGSEDFYADEGPVHTEVVEPFWIDRHPVTNRRFAAFVDDTGHLTTAERELPEAEYPELTRDERAPGALVFHRTAGAVDLREWRQWWRWVPGASWRHPFGLSSSIESMTDHPVVQVSYNDARAYAAWAGKRLATEAEWEFAARSGLDGATFAWGETLRPDGRLMANTWQGAFPYSNTGANGWVGTSPVGAFPANRFGLFDMIGNVWEWTSTPYSPRHDPVSPCCVGDPRDVGEVEGARRALKGGSHLCAPEYCLRYRPAARSPQSDDTSTTHIGFRCVQDHP